MYSLQELQPMIISWANDKNFVKEEFAPKQRLKLIEECGELASAILKNKVDEQKDAIGDIFVVLVILHKQLNIDVVFDMSLSNKKTDIDELIILMLFSSTDSSCLGLCLEFLKKIIEVTNLDLTECANIAWNEIKNRTGKTVDGTFIKD